MLFGKIVQPFIWCPSLFLSTRGTYFGMPFVSWHLTYNSLWNDIFLSCQYVAFYWYVLCVLSRYCVAANVLCVISILIYNHYAPLCLVLNFAYASFQYLIYCVLFYILKHFCFSYLSLCGSLLFVLVPHYFISYSLLFEKSFSLRYAFF